ncbi:hypothetical protein OKW96_05085 [Sphingobacterium sp. KU25419]|nr:hypothetical protein OKW96_05085 [Sphingobacterium sp. KU25419]
MSTHAQKAMNMAHDSFITDKKQFISMKSYTVFLRFILVATILTKGLSPVQAQNGDQILDGIGETGMIARYVFNGDLKDWSRNNLHATAGRDAQFITDKRFGKVLSLSGESNDFIQIPADALTDMESLSISGWVYLRSEKKKVKYFLTSERMHANISSLLL